MKWWMLITLAGTLAAQEDPLGKYYGGSCAKGGERQLSQLAQNVATNPNDVSSRLLFAECSSGHDAMPADRWAHWRGLRVQYVLWLTEHFPESQSLVGGMARLYPAGSGDTTAEEYQIVRDTRIRLADKAPSNADLQANTGYFFTFHELFLAEKYYRRALDLEPGARVRSHGLGSLYAEAILWADGRPKGITRDAPPPDLHSFGIHAVAQLRLTKNASVIYAAAAALYQTDPGTVALAESLRKRAQTLDPRNNLYTRLSWPPPIVR